MSIAPKLRAFLERRKAVYEIVDHPPTESAMQSAKAAHIPPSCVAKAVLLDLPGEHMLAVLPSDRRIELGDLRDELGGDKPRLADEGEVQAIFDDCEPGAVPPIGGYGIVMIIDDSLTEEPDIFFEAGDHRSLIHVEQAEFQRLTSRARHGHFGTRDWIED